MIRSITLLATITILLSGCNQKVSQDNYSDTCLKEIGKFIRATENSQLEKYFGLSIIPRGFDVDDEGKRYIRSIQYTNDNKKQFVVSSNQSLNGNPAILSSYEKKRDFASNYGVDLGELDSFINEIVKEFDELNIMSMNSQLSSGKFIEIKINSECTIWYKEEGAYLNDRYKTYFERSQIIENNWYLLEDKKIMATKKI